MNWRSMKFAALAALLAWRPAAAQAHALTITQVQATFDVPGILDVVIDLDLTSLLASPEAYFALSNARRAEQTAAIERLLPDIRAGLQLRCGAEKLELVLDRFALPRGTQADFLDPGTDKFATLRFTARLPASRAPLQLVVPYGARVAVPVAFTVHVPAAKIAATSWVEDDGGESEVFFWDGVAPAEPTAPARAERAGSDVQGSTRSTLPATRRDGAPWYRDLATYLQLGFRHIVPEGADHILFVLGLFFLGITWQKLLAQTTVFTVAHATTLFLSTYGIVRLPSSWVEPAIALSIVFIALENVFSPKLGPGRLAVVFAFGLIHGLGFASSLQEVAFPQHDFLFALLGFNFGVDAGQLFIIGLAFLAVGWFRHRPWFRARIAIPGSLAIAAIGLVWAVQRIGFYWFS